MEARTQARTRGTHLQQQVQLVCVGRHRQEGVPRARHAAVQAGGFHLPHAREIVLCRRGGGVEKAWAVTHTLKPYGVKGGQGEEGVAQRAAWMSAPAAPAGKALRCQEPPSQPGSAPISLRTALVMVALTSTQRAGSGLVRTAARIACKRQQAWAAQAARVEGRDACTCNRGACCRQRRRGTQKCTPPQHPHTPQDRPPQQRLARLQRASRGVAVAGAAAAAAAAAGGTCSSSPSPLAQSRGQTWCRPRPVPQPPRRRSTGATSLRRGRWVLRRWAGRTGDTPGSSHAPLRPHVAPV